MSKKVKLSVVLATLNEEQNIGPCLESVKDIADEIIVFDEFSVDKTSEIARKYSAKVYKHKHKTNFHETKQKAIDKAKGEWILQLDADERVSPELAKEMVGVVNSDNSKLLKKVLPSPAVDYGLPTVKKAKLFLRHQRLIEKREGKLGKPGENVVAFFIPRLNYFLGKPLIYAGVYPDGVIRLIKRGKARLPGKSVHEVMQVDGQVGWVFNDLEHHESPTLRRYIDRMNRYTDLHAGKLKQIKVPVSCWNFFKYSLLLPTYYFLLLFVRHKGFLDGPRGFLWSFLSSLHFPIAYYKYYSSYKKRQ